MKCRRYNSCRFEGKSALIVGASSGIGLAVAHRLAHEGASVVVCDRSAKQVEEAVTTLCWSGICPDRICGAACRVEEAHQRQEVVQGLLKQFGRLDVLFVNTVLNDAKQDAGAQVRALFQLVEMAVPHMKKNRGGSIIFNMSHEKNLITDCPEMDAATRAHFLSLVHSMAKELGPHGIRVNAVAPGLLRRKIVQMDKPFEFTESMETPREVAEAVSYLASSDASKVSGEVHMVCGGLTARL